MWMKILRGLPGSGKSTLAKELAVKSKAVIVSRDYLRQVLKSERKVLEEEDNQILYALGEGKNVIVDDTNLRPERMSQLIFLAKDNKTVPEIINISTPLKECIARDLKRPKPVGAPAIVSLWKRYIRR